MPFKKGQSGNATGRTAGVPNKVTAEIKDMVRTALDQAGGVEYLKRQAHNNPGPFLALVGKIIPSELQVHFNNPLLRMDITDVAKLAIAIGRERGIAIPSSLAKLSGTQAGDLPALRKAEVISQPRKDA